MVLYVTSWDASAGKTALCVGIGKYLQNRGQKVGYLKPVVPSSGVVSVAERDAMFAKQALGLEEPLEVLCPQEVDGDLGGACSGVAKAKDVVLVEGMGAMGESSDVERASYGVAETLDAKVIIVISYTKHSSWAKVRAAVKGFDERLLGVVVNKVPTAKLDAARKELTSVFREKGVRILGILPEERALLGVSVAEVAEYTQATVVSGFDYLGSLAANVMVGAMCVGSGVDYFGGKTDKLVVARGERHDMQMAALATSTNGLLVTGGTAPIAQVLELAKQKRVPVLATKEDTLSTLEKVEAAIVGAHFGQQEKIEKFQSILAGCFDLEVLGVGSSKAN